MGVTLPTFSVLLFQRTLPHLARHSDPLQALCVRCFQPSHSLRFCSLLVCCLASLCISCAVVVLFCLYARVLLCPRYSFPGPLLWGGAVTEVLHDLRSGLALSSVRHDLPCKKKKNKKKIMSPRPCAR
jgi:hypothetical protein